MQMMKNNRGKASGGMWLLGLIAAAVLIVAGVFLYDRFAGNSTLSITGTEKPNGDIVFPDGVTSVNMLFNDRNALVAGTDPSLSMTIFQQDGADFALTVADDSTTAVYPSATYKAMIGHNGTAPSSTYFAKEVSFDAGREAFTIGQEEAQKVYRASAPTISILNDNGVTLNSDSNDEATGASDTYGICLTLKAPTDASASEHGAYLIAEYDATYVSKVEPSTGVSQASQGFLLGHVTNQSSSNLDFDQYQVMKFSGTLRDGEKKEVCVDVTTASSAPGEDQANVLFHWVPIGMDLDSDTLEPITGLYDEDNNIIYLGNTTAYWYTS